MNEAKELEIKDNLSSEDEGIKICPLEEPAEGFMLDGRFTITIVISVCA